MILIGVDYALLNLVLGCSRRMESRDWVPVRQVSENAISHKSRPPSRHAMSLSAHLSDIADFLTLEEKKEMCMKTYWEQQ